MTLLELKTMARVAGLLVLGAGSVLSAPVTYLDFISRLTDLEALALLPAPGEKCAQWSSYDRASKYDAAAGRYVNWDANGDGDGVIRAEGGLLVLAEMEGPGCLWRIWSAAPAQGHVRIYLDGQPEPAVDLPFQDYFNLTSPPFIYPTLVHDTASGKNCYVPIPYQKSCKIVAEKKWGAYYHFTYTTYPRGTRLSTFRRELQPEERAALARANRLLAEGPGADPAGSRPGEVTTSVMAAVAAGKSATLLKIPGARAISGLRVRVDPALPAAKQLRDVALRVSWDGEAAPSVWAPLGDFFGTGPGINNYQSLPMGSANGTFYSYWYMPFATGAEVELVNDGDTAFQAPIEIVHAPLTRPTDQLGRFHAKWHRDAFLPAEPERGIDWPMLKTAGRGRFCGVALEVWNPRGHWWGEGDEKFFVDGEKFPSTFGTGSEDYFGYAWCNPRLFQNAYHNQTRNDGNNKGHVSVNRWQITDNVPFQTALEASIEKYYPNKRPTRYACTAYFYLAAGQADPYQPVSAADRAFYDTSTVFRAPGVIEAEQMKVIQRTQGESNEQEMWRFEGRWSGDEQHLWHGGRPGARIIFELPVPAGDRCQISAQFTKAPEYGVFQLWLDDQKLGGPLDLYFAQVVPSGEMVLGERTLGAGAHRLAVQIIGANPQAKPRYSFGLDYLKLETAK
jgi:hypothetical protein